MSAPWTPDTGDGRYRNPVLFADWSDPDVIRVGDDYWMTASSFHRVPGLPILHSRDLVGWRIVGHALSRLVPEEHYAVPRPGCGVWAPALRFHDGRFWIFYPDPDFGIYVITADHPAGPWSPPRLILPGRGLIDPCPLWDADGRAYLVHAWARSRCGFNNKLFAYEFGPGFDAPPGNAVLLVDGDAIRGCRTLEGPKWYRRDGWYWLFAPGGGVAHGWQYAMRSRHVFGPYEPRIVLSQGETPVNGPHQGAWVDDWFVHFQDRGAFGRVVHLQPLRWNADGWPVIGDGGTPVPTHRKPAAPPAAPAPTAPPRTPTAPPRTPTAPNSTPAIPSRTPAIPPRTPAIPPRTPASSDDFADGRPGPQWTWAGNPAQGWLLPAANGLRLACVPGDEDLRAVPHLLGQRLSGPRSRVETSVRLRAPDGARAGLVVCGHAYAEIGLEQRPGGQCLVLIVAEADGKPETTVSAPIGDATTVRLAVTVGEDAVARFAADTGTGWRAIGRPFTATPGGWIGATVGLVATGDGTGSADFGAVTVVAPGPLSWQP
ncbi:glycoside hydrolase 43 family protein [Actinoplanes sp. NPDC051851]|uniref:glycoside hydrolase family 43 protein n=1 Tax=Actinoplanes sp. NPDC051851 TaxID=3154753 RepID=UPI00341A2238